MTGLLKPWRVPGGQRDRGAAAVEFALVLPIVLLLVFGIIDFGRLLNAQIIVTDAAGEGARANALNLPLTAASGDSITSRVNTAASTLGSVSVPAGSATLCNSASAPAVGTITVQYSFQYVTPLGSIMKMFGGSGLSGTTVSAKGVMTCQN